MESLLNKIPRARWTHIIPVIIIVNIFYMMDRQSISVALPGGMMKDLAMSATIAGFISGVTAIGMLFLQVQAGSWAQKGLAKKTVTISILCWSGLSVITGFIQSPEQLIVLRFLLGVSEGVVMPSMTTLLTFWFPDKDGERNRAMSSYFTGNIIAMVIMGPLAGSLIAGFGWRLMFIILGGISFGCCAIWAIFIAERPEKAKWLSKEERDYIVNTINEEREAVKNISSIEVKGNKLPIGKLLANKYVWILIGMAICSNFGIFGFTMWMPTMLKEITKAGILGVGLLTILPNVATFIGLWTVSYIVKKSDNRRFWAGFPMIIIGAGLIGTTIIPKNPVLGVGMICFVAFFMMSGSPASSTLPSLLFPKELDGPVRGLIGVGSGIGSFLGPYIVGFLMTKSGGNMNAAMYFMAGMLTIGFLLSYALPRYLGVAKKSG